MKKKSTLFSVCLVLLISASHLSELLAQKKYANPNMQDDTLTLTLKVKPDDYVYPQVLDSTYEYRFSSDNDSVPFQKKIHYQDKELRDTAIYTFDYDTTINDWVYKIKQEKIYNNGDNSPSEKTYEWNEVLQRWVNQSWRRRIINSKQNVDAYYLWNAIINEWVGNRIDSTILESGEIKSRFVANSVDLNNEWLPSYRQDYTRKYSVDSSETTIYYYSYNSEEQEFIPTSINRAIYVNGLLESRIYHQREDDELVLDRMYRYEYNNNGKTTLYEMYYYNLNLELWELNEFREYQYNFRGERISNIRHRWSGAIDDVIPFSKFEYSYSTDGVTQSINYSWDGSSEDWIPKVKREYNYNDAGKVIEDISSDWNESDLEWEVTERELTVYDEFERYTTMREFETNKIEAEDETEVRRFEYGWIRKNEQDYLTHLYSYRWDNSSEKLIGSYGTINILNEQGKFDGRINLTWDTSKDDWAKSKYTIFYNSLLPASTSDTVIVQDTLTLTDTVFVDNPIIIRDTVYQDLDTINVVVYDTIKVIDTVTVTVVDTTIFSSIDNMKVDENTISLYPNPARDLIYLENPRDNTLNYEIHSMDGKTLYQGVIRGSGTREKVNVNDLKPGFYIVVLYDTNAFYKQLKFLKQ